MIMRAQTGIPGLDELIEGGFPRGRCILLCGGPGTGKTMFCLQYLYHGAVDHGEPGIFVTMEETLDHLKAESLRFGWDLEKLMEKNLLEIIDVSPVGSPSTKFEGLTFLGSKEFRLGVLTKIIQNKSREIGAKRIAVDPLTALGFEAPDSFQQRRGLLELFRSLAATGATSLVTSEMRHEGYIRGFQIEEYLSHGVIIFYNIQRGAEVISAIQIEKMRQTDHDRNLRIYKIGENGITIYPTERVYTN